LAAEEIEVFALAFGGELLHLHRRRVSASMVPCRCG